MLKLILSATALLVLCSAVHAELLKPSGKVYESTWPQGNWNGKVSFSNVLCATVPHPENAWRLTEGMFSGGAVYLAKVSYPDRMIATIVASTIPRGRTAEQDIAMLLKKNHETATQMQATGGVFIVTEMTTSFGPTIGIRINNIVSDTSKIGPFPLSYAIASPKKDVLVTMSVHRLFARGPDRFEVAVMQMPKPPGTSKDEAEMEKRLAAVADSIVSSFQQCTGALPARIPK